MFDDPDLWQPVNRKAGAVGAAVTPEKAVQLPTAPPVVPVQSGQSVSVSGRDAAICEAPPVVPAPSATESTPVAHQHQAQPLELQHSVIEHSIHQHQYIAPPPKHTATATTAYGTHNIAPALAEDDEDISSSLLFRLALSATDEPEPQLPSLPASFAQPQSLTSPLLSSLFEAPSSSPQPPFTSPVGTQSWDFGSQHIRPAATSTPTYHPPREWTLFGGSQSVWSPHSLPTPAAISPPQPMPYHSPIQPPLPQSSLHHMPMQFYSGVHMPHPLPQATPPPAVARPPPGLSRPPFDPRSQPPPKW